MENKEEVICPVPSYQVPTEEFKGLKQSWFFSLPLEENTKLRKMLLISWIVIFPIMLIISNGSVYIKNNIIVMIFYCALISLLAPLSLLTRQILGWSYINKRLTSKDIEYEESGWWDGQIWEKPNVMREKDLLISQHEVSPIISQLKHNILIISVTIILGTLVLFQLPHS